ncbi:MAG: KpsF/GutQ family sugar-phosphate isomerase [Leptospiraceae bacterium]|nr:KpsF/GutQ family sugar-phosphate isomerase [Leptospiraceae bacterium]
MSDILNKVKKAVEIEVNAIKHFQDTLDPNFENAVKLILDSKGKVIVTGVGKSGDIAKKISSTMSSTGTPAIFLHPTDSAHGDAGLIGEGDVIIAIGKSGESDELIALIPTIKKIGAKLIGITANPKSKLALACDVTIITPILQEACPLALAPTSSTTIALIAGDAIAMALMELKNFQADDFALFHPAGRLGKRLSLEIEDVMRSGENNAVVTPEANLETILNEITTKRLGAVGVVNPDNHLIGFITDFDIRKALTQGLLTKEKTAREIMNPNPSSFKTGMKAYDVLVAMEDRNRPISTAPITDQENHLVGIVLIHDLLQRGL